LAKRIKILPLPLFVSLFVATSFYVLFVDLGFLFFVWLVCLLDLKAFLVLSVCLCLRQYVNRTIHATWHRTSSEWCAEYHE